MSPKKHSPLRTLSIGGATYDLFLSIAGRMDPEGVLALKAGEKIAVQQVVETCGGGACNTAVGLARLGNHASFCGVIGSDQWGERLLATFVREGVSTSSATIVEDETSSFSIIVNHPSGERTILAAPGTSEHLHDVTCDIAEVGNVDCVYVNHLTTPSCAIEDNLIAALNAVPKVHLTWNPGGTQINAGMCEQKKRQILQRTNLLLLNKEEAEEFTRTSSIHDALRALIQTGVQNVCITDGKYGVVASNGKEIISCPAMPHVTIVDTTGAGDAFGVGATWALLHGESLPTALMSGTLNASSVLGAIGAQAGLLRVDAMEKGLASHALRIDRIPF